MTVELTPSKDNTLYENLDNVSNGAGQHFFAGNNLDNADINTRRGLIQFDIADIIPAGSYITNVELRLHLSSTGSGTQDVTLYKLLEDWGEGTSNAPGSELGGTAATAGDATWKHSFFNTIDWDDSGGTFNENASATLAVGGLGGYTWSSEQMIIDVQNWLLDPITNFGWILRGNETQSDRFKGFDSKENPIADSRPVLTVTYMPTSVKSIAVVQDNTLFESESGGTSNGAGQYLFAGKSLFGNVIRRAAIKFDFDSQIPADATLEGVFFTMNMTESFTGEEPVSLHKITKDWGEGTSDGLGSEEAGAASTMGDVTWLHTFYDSQFWTKVGGDFNATSSATINVGSEDQYTWRSEQMKNDIQGWIDDPSTNFGWMLIGNESTSLTVKRFSSKESTDGPPSMYVFYTQESVPVEFINFYAETENRNVILNWATASEINNEGFEIEHSDNGHNFRSIGFVKGNGQSTKKIEYQFRDKNPVKGVNFYRLKQMDSNGIFEYSKVARAEIQNSNQKESLLVFPNPANQQISIQQINGVSSKMQIFNSSGKLLKEVQLYQDERNSTRLDISDWPIGKYFIRGSHGEQAEFIKIQ
jgi:hypothetical protein